MADLHDLLRTPPFFPEDERGMYRPGRPIGSSRSLPKGKSDKKSKEKSDGFLRKLMTGLQGFGRGGIPGAYFSVADYDTNKKARQQRASIDMQEAIAAIEKTRSETFRNVGAGESSMATGEATTAGMNRANQMQPGLMRARDLENTGLGLTNDASVTGNAIEEFKRLNQQTMFDADLAEQKSRTRQAGSLADESDTRNANAPAYLDIARQNANSGTARADAAGQGAASLTQERENRSQLTVLQRTIIEKRALAQREMISGNPEDAAKLNEQADALQLQVDKASNQSPMQQLVDAQIAAQITAAGGMFK